MGAAGFALFLLGICFVITAQIHKKKNARCSEQAKGMLVDIKRRYNSEGNLPDMYYYSYFVDGEEYQIKSTVRASGVHAVGEECTIWYNPKKLQDAQPFHYASSKVYRIILIAGIVMILAGIVLFLAGISN